MSTGATFESFERELNRLVESFGRRVAELKQPGYAEAQLRAAFLDPFTPEEIQFVEGGQ